MDDLLALICLVAAGFLVLWMGSVIGAGDERKSIVNDCEAIGAFRIGSQAYECKKKASQP